MTETNNAAARVIAGRMRNESKRQLPTLAGIEKGDEMIAESNIVHESGNFWVLRERAAYTVYKVGLTHSISDSSYRNDADGLSVAIARCDYLAKREEQAAEVTTTV